MKTVYIPSGESRSYEYLVTDNLIVNGHLNVVNGVKARNISGRGVITAGTVYCDVSTVDEIETTTVVCRRLMARRVSAAEVFAICISEYIPSCMRAPPPEPEQTT